MAYLTYSNWLILVAAMRLLAVVLGYTYPLPVFGQNLETQLFDIANTTTTTTPVSNNGRKSSRLNKANNEETVTNNTSSGTISFTPLAGRTFAVWTTVTCLICLITASDPTNTGLLKVTLGTFVIALGYFVLELFVYKTVSVRTAIRPAIIACKYNCFSYLSIIF